MVALHREVCHMHFDDCSCGKIGVRCLKDDLSIRIIHSLGERVVHLLELLRVEVELAPTGNESIPVTVNRQLFRL